MFPGDDRANPAWMRLGPAPRTVTERGDPGRPLDGAWRLWEILRGWDQRFALALDAAIALGLFILCSGFFGPSGAVHFHAGFSAALTLPLVFRRRVPIVVFGLLAGAALVQWVLTGPLLADAALLVALYTVAADAEWPQVIAAALVLETGVILATIRWAPVDGHFKSGVFLTGMASAALSAGVVVRALRSQMGWLAERANRLELERDQQASLAAAAERSRIAREMHDVVSHNIQVMVTLADAAAIAQRSNPDRATEAMDEVAVTGRQALTDMRALLGLLRDDGNETNRADPTAAGPAGAALAPQPGLDDLGALVDRVCSTGLVVTVERSGQPFELSDAAGLTVYRIVQEALTNALKHARSPLTVRVAITFDDPQVSVRVTDDGRSLGEGDADRAGPATNDHVTNGNGGGHGVAGMAERAAAFGGNLHAGPIDGGGWQVEATLLGSRASARP